MRIIYGPFEPDQPGNLSKGLQEAINVYPAANGYRPVKAFAAAAPALPTTVLGASAFVSPRGSSILIAGTASTLYKSFANAWTALGSGFNLQQGDRWRFAQFGGLAVATNGVDPVQKVDLSSMTLSALEGNPPLIGLLAVVKDFLVGGVIDGEVNMLQWSGINDAEFWTPAVNQSDYQIMPTGGEITGLLGGEFGIILQRGRISRMTYVGDNLVFQFDEISYNVGCVSRHSVAQAGALGFFLSDNGFMMWTGAELKPIGYERVDRTFAASYDRSDWPDMSTAVDAVNNLVAWSMGDRMFVYNWVLDRWSIIEQAAEIIFSGFSRGLSLEELGAVYGDMDDPAMPSLDDDTLKGGDPRFYVFDASHAMGTFSGANMQATLTTGDLVLSRDSRESRVGQIRPLTDATAGITLTIGSRRRLGDTLPAIDYTYLTDEGDIPVRESGRFMRFSDKRAAAAVWTYSQGLETVEAKAGGRR